MATVAVTSTGATLVNVHVQCHRLSLGLFTCYCMNPVGKCYITNTLPDTFYLQVMIISVSQKFDAYARSIKERLHTAQVQVDFENDPGLTLNKKIRNAQLEQYNFIVVVGEKEETNNTVNIRTRNNKVSNFSSVLKRQPSKNYLEL